MFFLAGGINDGSLERVYTPSCTDIAPRARKTACLAPRFVGRKFRSGQGSRRLLQQADK